MVKIAIIGYGPRGENVFARYIEEQKDDAVIVAVAEPSKLRLERAKNRFSLEKEMCFDSAESFFKEERMCDAVIIATSDGTHVKYAQMAAQRGYHILLEKPISDSIDECVSLAKTIKKAGVLTTVCHELRYGLEYSTIKRLLNDGRVGRPMHIMQEENVSYWHQAHSFIRGAWRNRDNSSPMILAKCCHDTDLMLWLLDKEVPKRVSSFGDLSYFKKENAPDGATEFCLGGCKVKKDCPFDCEKYYMRKGIPDSAPKYVKEQPNLRFILVEDLPTEENLYQAMKTTSYGKCVFLSDNNVVDHQIVNVEFESGVTGTLMMSGFTADNGRKTRILCTNGEIEYNEMTRSVVERVFGKSETIIDLDKENVEKVYGHDGADRSLLYYFVKQLKKVQNGEKVQIDSAIDMSINGHLVALAAEESRLKHGEVQELKKL